MDINTIIDAKGAAATEAGPDQQLHQQLLQAAGHDMSETASDRANSPSKPGHMNGNPPPMQAPVPMMQQYPMGAAEAPPAPPKAFPCGTCGKAFARRSDLARHERIHSGERPHVCEYEGCGKQFIQRSALTVHARVHTGEKPHMCERCGKPFSDSSSLARHRRIHSGKRPYKCPYADCQKTFTRRTTLTRHQNHHTGTVEDAARATALALANRTAPAKSGRTDGESNSPKSTPSPGQRKQSMSPNAELAPITMQRHPSDYGGYSPLPTHLREYSAPSPQPAPTSFSNGARPTSHPQAYALPPILEPPATQDPRGSTSAGGSPHPGWQSPANMASPSGSQSYVYPDPEAGAYNQAPMGQMYYPRPPPPPPSAEGDSYDTKPRTIEPWADAARRPQSAEPDGYEKNRTGAAWAEAPRRPQSTEPDEYEGKARGGEVWAAAAQ